jgi:hypothetical protein
VVRDLSTTAGGALTGDAAIALGLAATAMPFARSEADQAERWLRVLRAHGEAGAVLKGLGMSPEAGAPPPAEEPAGDPSSFRAASAPGDAVTAVAELAGRIARERHARAVGTIDVLVAAMRVYGPAFDRALEAHGTNRRAVLRAVARRT